MSAFWADVFIVYNIDIAVAYSISPSKVLIQHMLVRLVTFYLFLFYSIEIKGISGYHMKLDIILECITHQLNITLK